MLDVTVIGAGEYVSGLSPNQDSDKKKGVIALTLFDLRRRGLVGSITICARDPKARQELEQHFKANIETCYGLDSSFHYLPKSKRDVSAWQEAIGAARPGSVVIVVTPDSLHYEIARFALQRRLHVLVAKPVVETLDQHRELIELSQEQGVVLRGEYHKRYDPMYRAAILRAPGLGRFNFFSSYMSQPKKQLETFRDWAGVKSDISSYLNSHHIDLHAQMVGDRYKPARVIATASGGIGRELLGRDIADTISLSVVWESVVGTEHGIANYVASWTAPPSDVHSQQRFFFSGEEGEIRIDQAHRGYHLTSVKNGPQSPNPLFMQYTPMDGKFVGQGGYGYQSIEIFLRDCLSGRVSGQDHNDLYVTAILEGGRISLERHSQPVSVQYEGTERLLPSSLDSGENDNIVSSR